VLVRTPIASDHRGLAHALYGAIAAAIASPQAASPDADALTTKQNDGVAT